MNCVLKGNDAWWPDLGPSDNKFLLQPVRGQIAVFASIMSAPWSLDFRHLRNALPSSQRTKTCFEFFPTR
jgi:hypothetical protein